MCVLALAWQACPRWRLVLAGNRDEAHARPADPLAAWPEAPQILAGRDRLSQGTWLGVSTQGRLAVVTNLRGFGPPDPAALSRGALTAGLLRGEPPPDLALFNPFNLIHVAGGGAELLTNRPAPARTPLPPGLYGLSNAALDAPWPKTLRLKAALAAWLARPGADPEALLPALADEARGPGDPPQAAVFIRAPAYGTRCSTVVAIDAAGQGVIVERRFARSGEAVGDTRLPFSWP